MSSLIISRIILTAFLAISLSACSKGGSGGSKANVRQKGGQNAQKTMNPADASNPNEQADGAETPEKTEKPSSATPDTANGDDELNETGEKNEKSEPAVSGGGAAPKASDITITPIAPKVTATATPAPIQQPRPVQAPAAQPAPATRPQPSQAQPRTSDSSARGDSFATQTSGLQLQPQSQPAKQPQRVAPSSTTDQTQKRAEQTSASTPAPRTSSADLNNAEKVRIDNMLSAEKQAREEQMRKREDDYARSAVRREIVLKHIDELDKDDTSAEKLGRSAYKNLVDKLLKGLDMSRAVYAKNENNEVYYASGAPVTTMLSAAIIYAIHNTNKCNIELYEGCLLVESTSEGDVIGSYIGFRVENDPQTAGGAVSLYYRSNIQADAETQKKLEIISRVAGGKTVVIPTMKSSVVTVDPASTGSARN